MSERNTKISKAALQRILSQTQENIEIAKTGKGKPNSTLLGPAPPAVTHFCEEIIRNDIDIEQAFPNAKRTKMIPLMDFMSFITENKLTQTE